MKFGMSTGRIWMIAYRSMTLAGTALAAGVTLGEWSSWKVRTRRPLTRRA